MDNLLGSAEEYVAVTPSDTTDFMGAGNKFRLTRGIYVGGAGNVAVVDGRGDAVTFSGAVAGSVIPVRCKRVNSTNTTATNLVALF